MNKLLVIAGASIVGFIFMNRHKTMSENGLNMLKDLEGFSSTSYRDGTGFSIGYGHFILSGENYQNISENEALALLQKDLVVYENVVNNAVTVSLSQNMFDALVLLVYNIGGTNFRTSTLLRVLNDGNYLEAQKQFSVWNKSRESKNGLLTVNTGLVNRRQLESHLFLI